MNVRRICSEKGGPFEGFLESNLWLTRKLLLKFEGHIQGPFRGLAVNQRAFPRRSSDLRSSHPSLTSRASNLGLGEWRKNEPALIFVCVCEILSSFSYVSKCCGGLSLATSGRVMPAGENEQKGLWICTRPQTRFYLRKSACGKCGSGNQTRF